MNSKVLLSLREQILNNLRKIADTEGEGQYPDEKAIEELGLFPQNDLIMILSETNRHLEELSVKEEEDDKP